MSRLNWLDQHGRVSQLYRLMPGEGSPTLEELLKKCAPPQALFYRLSRDLRLNCVRFGQLSSAPIPVSSAMTPILFLSPVLLGILLMKLVSPQVGLLTCAALLVASSIYSLASFKGELP